MRNSKTKPVTDSQISSVMERVGDKEYKLKADAVKPFEVSHTTLENMNERSLCGNVRLRYSLTGKAKIGNIEFGSKAYSSTISSGEQISSHLALYRLISMFECGTDSADSQDFYKMNWSITVRHKESGEYLMFGEWKGHFQIFTSRRSDKDLNKKFIKDAERLCTVLAMENLPIGYDGTVAGSEA